MQDQNLKQGMIGAKSRDAPRRARPKAALNLVRIANGMDS